MTRHPLELIIEKADNAIIQEDFDTLMNIYSDDAVLVIKPGMNASKKIQIRKAFEAIAAHFNHTLHVHVGMLALARVAVLVEGVAVEAREAMRVAGKCAGIQSRITPRP
jgi:ketosteroid isomerase-like protein